jgi:hypothetical protein
MRPFALLCVLLALSVVQPYAVEAQEWNFHIVDDVGTSGYQSQVAVTSDGTPYILYKRGSDNTLHLAWWVPTGGNGGGWDKLDLGTSHRGYACEIVVDSSDYLHMAWDNTISIRYGVYDPATQTWVIPQEEAASQYGSLDLAAVEHNDTITAYIVYIHRYAPYHFKLCTRDPVSGSWSVETLHDEACSGVPSIAADSQGRLHVSFRETYSGSLMYATNANELTAWVSEYVDLGGDLGQYSSIVINESDVPYIVYYDAVNGDLKYARFISE